MTAETKPFQRFIHSMLLRIPIRIFYLGYKRTNLNNAVANPLPTPASTFAQISTTQILAQIGVKGGGGGGKIEVKPKFSKVYKFIKRLGYIVQMSLKTQLNPSFQRLGGILLIGWPRYFQAIAQNFHSGLLSSLRQNVQAMPRSNRYAKQSIWKFSFNMLEIILVIQLKLF